MEFRGLLLVYSYSRMMLLPSNLILQSGRCSCHRGALEVGRGDLLVVAVNKSVREEAGDHKGEGGVAAVDRAGGNGAQLRGVLRGSDCRSFAS